MLMQTRYTEGDRHLLDVATATREAPNPHLFSMSKFFHEECGTPACALGNYAFRSDLQSDFHQLGNTKFLVFRGRLVYWNNKDIQDYFEMTESELRDMFGASGCGYAKTPEAAADYIENFIHARVADRA